MEIYNITLFGGSGGVTVPQYVSGIIYFIRNISLITKPIKFRMVSYRPLQFSVFVDFDTLPGFGTARFGLLVSLREK